MRVCQYLLLFCLCCLYCLCVSFEWECVCHRKLQGVSVWAAEEGGPRPGLPDTGGKGKTLGSDTDTNTCAQIHTDAYNTVPPGSPLLTDASCPAAPLHSSSCISHTYTNSVPPVPLRADPGSSMRGTSTLWFYCGVIVYVGSRSSGLVNSPQPRQR